MNRKQREANRATYRRLMAQLAFGRICPECGKRTFVGHFAPPSFGEPGFFICTGRGG